MTVELASMAVGMPVVAGHPNRAAFRGVLTVVDVASQRAPSGSKGHLVLLTRAAAEAAIPSLMGMALDYAPTFDRHDVRRKVGIITQAEVVGRNLEVSGYLYARDFPEIVEEIAARSQTDVTRLEHLSSGQSRTSSTGTATEGSWMRRGWNAASGWKASLSATGRVGSLTTAITAAARNNAALRISGNGCRTGDLGMSYEVTDVQVADLRARVWTLNKVTFTGAAILRRDKAAYQDTWIELG